MSDDKTETFWGGEADDRLTHRTLDDYVREKLEFCGMYWPGSGEPEPWPEKLTVFEYRLNEIPKDQDYQDTLYADLMEWLANIFEEYIHEDFPQPLHQQIEIYGRAFISQAVKHFPVDTMEPTGVEVTVTVKDWVLEKHPEWARHTPANWGDVRVGR